MRPRVTRFGKTSVRFPFPETESDCLRVFSPNASPNVAPETDQTHQTIVHPRAGPELAYTVVFYNMCQKFNVEFLPARVWQGLWTALFTCMLSAFDASALMNRVTRFTEEIFAALISVIFIIEALTLSLIHI